MIFIISWLAVMFPLVFSPGPANIMFAANGANVGLRKSFPLMLGVDSVVLIKSILVGVGLGSTLAVYPEVIAYFQVIGSLYIFWLAMKFIKPLNETTSTQASYFGFKDGIILQLFNSKGWLMVILMFTLFTDQSAEEYGEYGIAIMIVMLSGLNILTHIVWIGMGALIIKLITKSSYLQYVNYSFALSLILVGLWLQSEVWFG
ncbi:LysE family translocator [Endozoicomonas sp. SM1973]|uniref:LysE family translocator n=1 Tax=Spartinivicinus marinus TaxID=2994442 RepID=A0A853IB46_9GAMM|nr:LysE family translocator [Spartinivicinus marinus]MCX4026812.1 LysE family translocator [Spartinivicinus marinus]NYZ64646.1 LysE family translocator [Spartinivicinus marinus]